MAEPPVGKVIILTMDKMVASAIAIAHETSGFTFLVIKNPPSQREEEHIEPLHKMRMQSNQAILPVDLFFEEDGQLVLVDYKTDVVPTPESLVDRYKTQVDYYQEALEKLTGKKVKERSLYSFYFGTEVQA